MRRVKGFDDLIAESKLMTSEFFYNAETFKNLTESYLDIFEQELQNHHDYENIKERFIIDREQKRLIQIHDKIPHAEIEDLNDEERFFYPLCSKSEINRIFNVKNSSDYLLKFRAEQVVDNQRLNRVYASIRRKLNGKWNFSRYFDSLVFQQYLDHLPERQRKICRHIPHGAIHLNEANGYCIKTSFGNVIVVSLALRQFLYYMNLFHFGKRLGLNESEIFPSFVLATRIMLGNESLDFEIDSRGEIPQNIHEEIENITDWQMLFVVGHEYAHHYLKHLEKSSIWSFSAIKDEEFKFYNFKQKDELEADFHSVINQKISNEERSVLANSAFLFFQWLDLHETVRKYMSPSSGRPLTHPDPLDRLFELRKRLNPQFGVSMQELNDSIEYYAAFKESLINEYLPFNIDQLEKFGSVYLSSYKNDYVHDRLL